ncbi:hypothetical protein J6590_007824 [Homalodisca vitripennis]|nr:hypothetical protein J6590_007824 [Homalodisca vitripennis]
MERSSAIRRARLSSSELGLLDPSIISWYSVSVTRCCAITNDLLGGSAGSITVYDQLTRPREL